MGSREASDLVRAYGPFVFRVLRHQGVPERLLEDLSQEVFIVVLRRLDGFEQRSSLRTWIYGICRNVASEARRRDRRKPELLTDAPPDLATPAPQARALAQGRARDLLRAALAELPEPARMVFVLYEIEHLPMAEVAETLDCTPSTAYSRLYAARKHVQQAFVAAGLTDDEIALAEVIG